MFMSKQVEEDAVREVIKRYISGTFRADISMLKGVFHEKAVMNGFLGDMLILADPTPFLDDMASAPSMESNNDPFRAEITSLSIEGNVAAVTLSETGFRGSANLVNYFHLIKTDGKWEIISKLFTTLGVAEQ